MEGEQGFKIKLGEKGATGVKAFLVLAVAALDLSVVPWCVRANELMTDTGFSGSFLKKSMDVSFADGKTVGKLKTVVGLDPFHTDASAGEPLHQAFEEISGRIGGLLKVSRQETEPGELIDSGVLEQAQLRVGDTPAGNYYHIHLDTLAEAGHLLLKLGDVSLFLLFPGKYP